MCLEWIAHTLDWTRTGLDLYRAHLDGEAGLDGLAGVLALGRRAVALRGPGGRGQLEVVADKLSEAGHQHGEQVVVVHIVPSRQDLVGNFSHLHHSNKHNVQDAVVIPLIVSTYFHSGTIVGNYLSYLKK